jgi:hypothetical protein
MRLFVFLQVRMIAVCPLGDMFGAMPLTRTFCGHETTCVLALRCLLTGLEN